LYFENIVRGRKRTNFPTQKMAFGMPNEQMLEITALKFNSLYSSGVEFNFRLSGGDSNLVRKKQHKKRLLWQFDTIAHQ